jgi:hypothetical protein
MDVFVCSPVFSSVGLSNFWFLRGRGWGWGGSTRFQIGPLVQHQFHVLAEAERREARGCRGSSLSSQCSD